MIDKVKQLGTSLVEKLVSQLSPTSQINLSLKIMSQNMSEVDSVKAYKLRRRLHNRFLKSYPMLYSHEAQRIYGFFHLLNQLKGIEGEIVEFGVGRGRYISIFAFANECFQLRKEIFGFDSFEGFPQPHENDIGTRVTEIQSVCGWDDVQPEMILHALSADISSVGSKSLFENSEPSVNLIKGYFKDTISDNLPNKIAFLHLDADLYESTKIALQYSLPRMSKGGIIIFDELHEKEKWPGVQKAVEEECLPKNLNPKWIPELQRFGIII